MFESRLLPHWLGECGRAVEALVFPWECSVCADPAAGAPFCPGCRRELLDASPSPCERCGLPMGPFADHTNGCYACRGRPLGFDRAIALGPYQGPIRDLCLRLKHEPNAWLAPWLVDVLLESNPLLRDLPSGTCVVPIPLHWRRYWERGYNQADALANALARRLRVRRLWPLKRVEPTPPLVTLARTERLRIMHDAFRVKSSASATLKGRTILLVDDILTTGATCGAAARALKRAGAARVIAVVIGRAEGKA